MWWFLRQGIISLWLRKTFTLDFSPLGEIQRKLSLQPEHEICCAKWQEWFYRTAVVYKSKSSRTSSIFDEDFHFTEFDRLINVWIWWITLLSFEISRSSTFHDWSSTSLVSNISVSRWSFITGHEWTFIDDSIMNKSDKHMVLIYKGDETVRDMTPFTSFFLQYLFEKWWLIVSYLTKWLKIFGPFFLQWELSHAWIASSILLMYHFLRILELSITK